MIHSAIPTISPVVNIVFAWNLFCFEECGRMDRRTTCAKTMISAGRDCGVGLVDQQRQSHLPSMYWTLSQNAMSNIGKVGGSTSSRLSRAKTLKASSSSSVLGPGRRPPQLWQYSLASSQGIITEIPNPVKPPGCLTNLGQTSGTAVGAPSNWPEVKRCIFYWSTRPTHSHGW